MASTPSDSDPDIIVSLPDHLRSELKDPIGPIYTDTADLITASNETLITVGDVVTYHCKLAGVLPDVAVIDGKTKREDFDETLETGSSTTTHHITVACPPGTLSRELIDALRTAISLEKPTVITVDGEEDLAVLPAILLAAPKTSIVYGQPDEGMVHAPVTTDLQSDVIEILAQMNGDTDELFQLI